MVSNLPNVPRIFPSLSSQSYCAVILAEKGTAFTACDRTGGTNHVSLLSSAPASIFAPMLLRGQVKHTGAFPPEVFDRKEIEIFYSGIRERGIRGIKQSRAAAV